MRQKVQGCGLNDRRKETIYSDRSYAGSLFFNKISAALRNPFFYCVFSGSSSESADREDQKKTSVEKRDHRVCIVVSFSRSMYMVLLFSMLCAYGADTKNSSQF